MTLQIATTMSGPGILYDLGATDSLMVLPGVTVSSYGTVVVSVGGDQSVQVLGTIGGLYGIDFSNSAAGRNSVQVGSGGTISAYYEAIDVQSSNSLIFNNGQILSTASSAINLNQVNGTVNLGKIINYGLIEGHDRGIYVGTGGDLRINNYGTIIGLTQQAIITDAGNDTLLNRGRIDGDVNLYTGNNTLLNRGLITGDVTTLSGSDLVDNRAGTIEGTILLGDGNDIFRPGNSVETVDGQNGTNLLDFSLSGAVRLALDGSIDSAGSAAGDTYTNFINVTGSAGNDTLIGDSLGNVLIGGSGNDILGGQDGADTLQGGRGADTLDGGAGNDTLDGGEGNDILTGGPGVDSLTGGAGADKFMFALADVAGSSKTSGTFDIINDFSNADGDKINLAAIDANINLAKDQAFTFIGATAFHNVAGELHIEANANGYYVQGDTNGDGVADFTIGVATNAPLLATDFVL